MQLKKTMIPLLALLCCSCFRSTLPDTSNPDTEHPYPHVAISDNLAPAIIADTATVSGGGTSDVPLKVVVPVRSTSDSDLNVDYRFEFLDASGRPLETEQFWRPIALRSRIQVFLSDSALSSRAVDWRLQIRAAVLSPR
jgi:uncharacterized protein YcfL